MRKVIVGIDCGIKGGIGVIDARNGKFLRVLDIPVVQVVENKKNKKQLDPAGLLKILLSLTSVYDVVLVSVERLWAGSFSPPGKRCKLCRKKSGGMGIAGQGNMLRDYGIVVGALVGLRLAYKLVTPNKWKNKILKGKGLPAGKIASVVLCQQIMPEAPLVKPGCRKPSDGRSDSLCIARYEYEVSKNHKE